MPRAEITYAAEFFRWFSEEAVRNVGEIVTAPSGTNRILVLRQPIGVALLITPWNFPAAMLTRKIGPALAAGTTVVCKPAKETPLSALAIAAILDEAGVPPGVVNVVPSFHAGAIADAALADNRVRKLSFTGSTEVGRMLLEKASQRVVSSSMELGGNAPFVIFADSNLDDAVTGAMLAKMRNGGEACTAANRFYVEAPIADEFVSRLTAQMSSLRMGNGLEDGVQLGPLVNADTRDKVAALVDDALVAGARATTGGSLPPRSRLLLSGDRARPRFAGIVDPAHRDLRPRRAGRHVPFRERGDRARQRHDLRARLLRLLERPRQGPAGLRGA